MGFLGLVGLRCFNPIRASRFAEITEENEGMMRKGTNVVVLEPDVAKAFPSAQAVNRSLRAFVEIIEHRKKAG
jgi:hypothetical protein